jgi:alkanesulfonate monooxygenase SsuD/methylene tetrahydromethanopterin reductase-like flavin-dependent oxidoreductase (luciferase family)
MAAVTKNLSFGITASTTYENPFLLARRFATLDHLTKGRVAFNAVTSHLDSAAKNIGLEKQIPHDERYIMADEYMTALYKLWEGSWRDDAVVKDDKQYTKPGRVRYVDHKGCVHQITLERKADNDPENTSRLLARSPRSRQFKGRHSSFKQAPARPERHLQQSMLSACF